MLMNSLHFRHKLKGKDMIIELANDKIKGKGKWYRR
jgi:hypothetical protein